MKQYYKRLNMLLTLFLCTYFGHKLTAQSPGTMSFGNSIVVLANDTNPSADQSTNSLLNNFNVSAITSNNRLIAFANSGNGAGTNVIGSSTDHVLSWLGDSGGSFTSATLTNDGGTEFGVSSMEFAYEQSTGASILNFTIHGKRDGSIVGTYQLNSPAHNSLINIDFSTPTSGSFLNIDEIVITPESPLTGGFSIDDLVIISAVSNTAPVIAGTSAGQTVNDNATISPFSAITTIDADGDNLSATITLDDNTKGVLSGTGLSGSGPYTIASTTPTDLQTKLRALSYNPTDNRTATTETTTFTVVIDDGTATDTDNTTTVISSAVAPAVTSVNVPANATYIIGQNLNFTVNFNENVTVNTTGGIPQVAITIGATVRQATYISGSGTSALVFRHTVLAGELDTDGIVVGSLTANGSTLKDTGGKDANLTLNSVGTTTAVLVDAVAPTVTSVNVPTNATYVSGQNLDFTVNFDENVTVNTTGGTPQIAVTIGATTRQATYQSGSGTSSLLFRYAVQSGDLDTDGIAIGTLVANGGTLKDAINNDANLTLNNVGPTTAVLVDAVAPIVTSVNVPANATYISGQNLDFTVNFNENTIVNTTGGTPQIAVTIGATTRQATYQSGSGTSALLFRYTVQSGDLDTDGITIGTLAVNGGTLKDTATNDANLTLNSVGATTAVLVDAVAPTISSVSIPNSAAKVGDAITVTITANEAGLSLNTGLINGTTVSGLTDNGGGNYTATYTVVEGNTDRAAGDDIPVNFILTDAAGNNSTAYTTAISQNADAIDANSPSITNVSIPNSAAKVGDAITVTITANEAGLSLNTGLINGTTASGLTDNGGGNYTVTYTVVEGNTDRAAGDDIPVNFILTDAAGNNSTAYTTAISQNADAIDANSPSITNVSIPNSAAKVGDAITVTITANEAGLSLNTGLINGTTASGLTDNGGGNYTATYTVVEGNTDRAAGDDIPVNFILTDAAGNNSTAYTTAISQNADAIDANSPTIISVSVPSDATYTTGQNLDFTVNFDENTTVNTTGGTPQIAITIGATTRQATYQSGSGTSALLFRYTVQSGDLDTDGITIGTLAVNGGTLKDTATNDANLTLNSVGSTTAVLVGSQNYTWTGATNNDWNTASNWDLNSVPSTSADIVIPSGLTNYPTASSAVTFNSLTINSGASFIPQSTVTGTVTYKRNLATTNWYLISSPVVGETAIDFITNSGNIATNGSGQFAIGTYNDGWVYNYSSILSSGAGFTVKKSVAGDLVFSGTAQTNNVARPTLDTTSDYNLFGNPYTAPMAANVNAGVNNILTTNTAIGQDELAEATIWFWNQATNSYDLINQASPAKFIAPGQGFFVKSKGGFGDSNFDFTTAMRSHQTADSFQKGENPSTKSQIILSLSDNNTSRKTEIYYMDGVSKSFDNGYDSSIFGGVSYEFNIYTNTPENNQGKKLGIQSLPNQNMENIIVPIGIKGKLGKEVTFSINTKNLPTNLKVYLEDKTNNIFTNLSEKNYTVTLNNNSDGIGQFYLHTSSKKPIKVIDPSIDNINIYSSSNNEVTITGLQAKANVAVYSILGKEITNQNITSNGVSKISLPNISTGVYIVKLTSDLGEISKKIILK